MVILTLGQGLEKGYMKRSDYFNVACSFIILFSLFSCSKEECSCLKEEEGQGVELGMMKGEVREILGDPYRTQNLDASGTKKKWFYLSSWNDKVVDAYI